MEEPTLPSFDDVRLDIAFALNGNTIPLDHGYRVFGALCKTLGNLHNVEWLAVHPIRGTFLDSKTLRLEPHKAELRLRVTASKIPNVIRLAGKTLDVAGNRVSVGVPSVYALMPAETLVSRLVVIKNAMDEESFHTAAQTKLQELGVSCNVEIGRSRIITISQKKVLGFSTVLTNLSLEDSLKVQTHGLGGRQRMGCGVFLPAGEENHSAPFSPRRDT